MPSYVNYPMVLNNVFIGMLGLRTDQIDYFNIPPATAAELALAKTVSSGSNYQRNLHSNRLDSVTPTRQVTVDRTRRSKDRGKDHLMRGGKRIIVPTELRSTPPSAGSTDPGATIIRRETVRTTTIKFPGDADISEISAWLHLKLVAHKPRTMKSPGGRAYAVAPFASGNTVTGADTTA